MSKRVRIIALAAAAVILALFIGIYAGVLNTGAGRRVILNALGPTLEDALGGEVEIGGTGGHWPHHIILRDVAIADEKGVWVHVPELSLRWNPFALITGGVSIDALDIPRGTLFRLPESKEPEPEAPALPSLPRLPDLRVGSLTVGALDVKSAAAGRETVLHVTGTAEMHAGLLKLSLDAGTDGKNADRADIDIDWTPSDDRLAAKVQITGPENGLLTRLAGIEEGRIAVSVSGKGPASGWTGKIAAEAGSYGSLSGTLACTCREKPAFRFVLDGAPGSAIPAETLRYLGESPHLEAALFSPEASSLTLEISALDSPAAQLVRPLRITLTETRRLLRFDVSGALKPGQALDEDVPGWLGESVELSARGGLLGDGGLRLAEASIQSEAAELNLERAEFGGDGSLDGIGTLRLLSPAALSDDVAEVTGKEASLGFSLAGNYRTTLRLEDLALESASGTGATGMAAYSFDRRAIEAKLDVTLPAPVFAALTGLPEPAEAVTGALTADGPLTELSAKVLARTPALELEARTLPPAQTTLDLSGGIDDPKGRLTVRRLDEEDRPVLLSADLAWPGRKTLNITGLELEIDKARLEGEARLAVDTGELTGKATLDVPDVSALMAGAAGSLSAEIALEKRGEGALTLAATVASPALSAGSTKARDVKVSASGPLESLKITASAGLIETPDTRPVRNLDLAAQAGVTEPLNVTVSRLKAIVDGTALALKAPTRLTSAEGTITLSETKLSWGEKGSITAAAVLAPDALKADLRLDRVAVPGRPMLLSGEAAIDTQAEQPGTLDLLLDPADGPQAAMTVTGTWNGERLELKGKLKGKGKQAGRLDGEIVTASIPLKLERPNGAFSVSTEGGIEGRLNYQGKLEPLLAIFVPEQERNLSGTLNADIRADGTLAALRVSGKAVLDKGRYEETSTGVSLTAINARLEFAGGTEGGRGTLKLTAWDGKEGKNGRAPVTGEGEIVLGPEGPQVEARIRLRKATLVRSRDLTGTLSGDAALAGTFPTLALTGDVRIDRLDLLIPENGPEGIEDVDVVLVNEKGEPLDPKEKKKEAEDKAAGKSERFGIDLDLKVRSEGQAFIRGRGLESEWEADLSVGGTIDEPKLNGALTAKKGKLTFGGRRFDLTKGEVSFTGQSPPDPVLNIAAEYEAEDETKAIVRVSGRTSDPLIKLDSSPPLPKEQVMALILFGKPVKELTALQALQVTQSIAALTGTGPFGGGGIMDRARRTLGLDVLDLTFGKDNGNVGLTVGRYVSEGVFVSATQDASGEGGKVSVEVEVTDEFSVKTDVGQDASGGVSAQWKKDY